MKRFSNIDISQTNEIPALFIEMDNFTALSPIRNFVPRDLINRW